MRILNLEFRIIFFALLAIALASPASAADICCSCTPPNETKTTCLNIDPTKLKNVKDCSTLPADIKLPDGWSCKKDPLTETTCRAVSAEGICQNGPKSALAYVGTEKSNIPSSSAKPLPAIPFTLNVPIPGFTPPADMSEAFNAYVYGVYRYLISIAAIVTTVMFIYGAFRYLVGSGVGGVARGKEIMIDSVIGLLLVLSATMILRTVNPELTKLKPLVVEDIRTVVYANPYIGNDLAPQLLTQYGLPPSGTAGRIPDYTIPLECPGRNPSYSAPYANRALSWQGQTLTPATINRYLEVQRATGIPAAVIIAQMLTETGRAGQCIALNLFNNVTSCGNSEYIRNYNFGGVGCTQKQVPSNACANLGFDGPAGLGGPPSNNPSTITLSKAQVNSAWNKGVSPVCVELLNSGATRDTYANCGESCFPLKSHTTVRLPDQPKEVWIPTIQCSRKFANADAFLRSHESYVEACLPYNDSVYSFAYCVGASMYASAGEKAKVLAEIIERNCLCDPERDSRKCVRDLKLEEDIKGAIVKKTNLFSLYSNGQFDTAAEDRVIKALWEKTQGRLVPLPMQDQNGNVYEEPAPSNP